MPTCFVPSCRSGYKSKSSPEDNPTGKTFHKFPEDEARRIKWIRAIHRENFTPSASSRVCSLHFHETDFVRSSGDSNSYRQRKGTALKRRYLQCDVIPSKFPHLPSYLTLDPVILRSEAATSTARLEKRNKEISDQISSMEKDNKILNLDDLERKFCEQTLKPEHFCVTSHQDALYFYTLAFDKPNVQVNLSIFVKPNLSFDVYHQTEKVKNDTFKNVMQDHKNISSLSDLLNLMAYLNAMENNPEECAQDVVRSLENYISNKSSLTMSQIKRYEFLAEQLLLVEAKPNLRRYSKSLLVHCLSWHSHGPSCYRSILDDDVLTLPSTRTLRRLCQNFDTSDESSMMSYLRQRRSELNDFEAVVSLMFDEVYVNQRPEYSNGKFIGLSDDGKTPAKTVLAFMIKSQASRYSDVIALIPLAKLSVSILRSSFLQALTLVGSAGFKVLCLIADNHPVNRSFFHQLCGSELVPCIPHPLDTQDSLFLIIDPVHTIKNIYNNFQRAGHFVFPSFDGEGENVARFKDIVDLFLAEKERAIKFAHRLNETALHPSNIQRSSVKHASAIFCESTCDALKYFIEKHDRNNWKGTFTFVQLITTLFKIINVKTSNIGEKKRDDYRKPITNTDSQALTQLSQFEAFFEKWALSRKPGLSSPTFIASKLMCSSLRQIAVYLIEKHNFKFVLLGHMQSDPLERRFGQYRQLSGANYFISVKQVLENERKIKILRLLDHSDSPLLHLQSSVAHQISDDLPHPQRVTLLMPSWSMS